MSRTFDARFDDDEGSYDDDDDEDDDDEDEDDTGTCTRLSTTARVDGLLIGIIGGEGGDDVSSFS